MWSDVRFSLVCFIEAYDVKHLDIWYQFPFITRSLFRSDLIVKTFLYICIYVNKINIVEIGQMLTLFKKVPLSLY